MQTPWFAHHAHLSPRASQTRRPAWVLALSTLCLLCCALPAHAQWKWRDASGRMQISDLPPPSGTPDKDILQRPAGYKPPPVFVMPYASKAEAAASAAAAASANTPSKADLDRQARQREQEKLEKQQEREAIEKHKQQERRYAEQKRENCNRAQENLRMLQDGMRISRRNAQGENVILDDRQRSEEIQRTRAIVASDCGGN